MRLQMNAVFNSYFLKEADNRCLLDKNSDFLKKGAVPLCFSGNLKEGVTNACSS